MLPGLSKELCIPGKSQNGIVGVLYRLRAVQQCDLGSVRDRGRVLSLLKSAQTGSGYIQTSHSMGTGDILPGVEWPRCEADLSLHKVTSEELMELCSRINSTKSPASD